MWRQPSRGRAKTPWQEAGAYTSAFGATGSSLFGQCIVCAQHAEEPPPSTAYLYSGAAPPAPPASDPADEEALMAAMGLPTALRNLTAAANDDEYKVRSHTDYWAKELAAIIIPPYCCVLCVYRCGLPTHRAWLRTWRCKIRARPRRWQQLLCRARVAAVARRLYNQRKWRAATGQRLHAAATVATRRQC